MTLPPVLVPHPHVELRADTLDGSPLVRGTKVPVRRLWAWHRRGITVETLVRRYPNLSWAKVLDALGFAYDNQDLIEADLVRERAMVESLESQPPLPTEGLASRVAEFVSDNPGVTSRDVRGALGASAATYVATLAVRGHVTRKKDDAGIFRYWPREAAKPMAVEP